MTCELWERILTPFRAPRRGARPAHMRRCVPPPPHRLQVNHAGGGGAWLLPGAFPPDLQSTPGLHPTRRLRHGGRGASHSFAAITRSLVRRRLLRAFLAQLHVLLRRCLHAQCLRQGTFKGTSAWQRRCGQRETLAAGGEEERPRAEARGSRQWCVRSAAKGCAHLRC